MSDSPLSIIRADAGDAPAIYSMVVALADSEGTRQDLVCDVETFRNALAGPHPRLHALLAVARAHGAVGVVTFTFDYAVWTGGEVLRVDDVFVQEGFRRQGVGRALMREIASICIGRATPCRWEIEASNTVAQTFYRSLGVDVRDKRVARWSLPAMNTQVAAG